MLNEYKITECGLQEYHNANLKGQGKTIVILDSPSVIFDSMSRNLYFAPVGEVTVEKAGIGSKALHSAYVAQVVHAAAPKANIVMLPFMTNDDREKSLYWLADNRPDIINMSLDLATADWTYPILHGLDIPIVAAAGNRGCDTQDVAEPAKFDWTLAVGGIFDNGILYQQNNSGENMDCLAYTNVTVLNSKGGEVKFGGTSCAAPWLCGMLATYYTNANIPSVYKMRELIKSYSIDILDVGKDKMSGYGFFKLPTLAERERIMAKTEIILELGKNTANINGKDVTLDCAPFAQDGRTYVPLRFVAENLGCNVNYNKGKITISKE